MKKKIETIEAIYRRVRVGDISYAMAREIVARVLREVEIRGQYSVYP